MLAADTGIGPWINAAVSIVVALVIATLLDRAFRARAARQAAERTGLSREGATRLRFVRRLIYATILLIGVAIALSGFTGINHLARSLLASGAIAAAIDRLRGPPGARQLRRRDHARGHPADPRRRLGDLRGQLRRRRGRPAQLHDPAHRRRRSGSSSRTRGSPAGSSRTTRCVTDLVAPRRLDLDPAGGRRPSGRSRRSPTRPARSSRRRGGPVGHTPGRRLRPRPAARSGRPARPLLRRHCLRRLRSEGLLARRPDV